MARESSAKTAKLPMKWTRDSEEESESMGMILQTILGKTKESRNVSLDDRLEEARKLLTRLNKIEDRKAKELSKIRIDIENLTRFIMEAEEEDKAFVRF